MAAVRFDHVRAPDGTVYEVSTRRLMVYEICVFGSALAPLQVNHYYNKSEALEGHAETLRTIEAGQYSPEGVTDGGSEAHLRSEEAQPT